MQPTQILSTMFEARGMTKSLSKAVNEARAGWSVIIYDVVYQSYFFQKATYCFCHKRHGRREKIEMDAQISEK